MLTAPENVQEDNHEQTNIAEKKKSALQEECNNINAKILQITEHYDMKLALMQERLDKNVSILRKEMHELIKQNMNDQVEEFNEAVRNGRVIKLPGNLTVINSRFQMRKIEDD